MAREKGRSRNGQTMPCYVRRCVFAAFHIRDIWDIQRIYGLLPASITRGHLEAPSYSMFLSASQVARSFISVITFGGVQRFVIIQTWHLSTSILCSAFANFLPLALSLVLVLSSPCSFDHALAFLSLPWFFFPSLSDLFYFFRSYVLI